MDRVQRQYQAEGLTMHAEIKPSNNINPHENYGGGVLEEFWTHFQFLS